MTQSEIRKQGITALIAGCCIMVFYGIKLSWSLFGAQLIAENGWTAMQASLPYSMQTIMSSLAAIFFGRLADKWQPRYIIMLCGLFTGGGLAMCGLGSTNWWLVFIGCGFFIAWGSGISAGLTANVIGWWAVDKKGKVGGLLTASNSFNSILLTPIINMMLLAMGMQKTCAMCGAIVTIAIAILALFIKKVPKDLVVLTKEKAAELDAKAAEKHVKQRKVFVSPYNNAPLHTIFTSKQFYMWMLLYLFACMSGQVASSQITLIAKTMVVWPEALGWVTVSVGGIGQFLGRYCMSALGDRIGAFRAYTVTFLIQTAICIAFPFFGGMFGMALGIFAISWGFGGAISLANVGNTDLWGKGNLGTMYGVTALSYSLAGLIGPTAASWIKDTTGNYTIMFFFLAACALIGIIFSEYLNRWADPAKQK